MKHDGRPLLPFMEFQGMSDEDLTAVISYLRTQAPVAHPVPAHELNLLGRMVNATVMSKPVGPASPPPAVSRHGATVENGRYLVESVSLCGSCHTQRDRASATFTGQRFGGATGMTDDFNPKRTWSPPNITTGGKLGTLTEDEFVARIHTGRVIPGSPMPWQNFQRMNDEDLRAIYKFLASMPAATADMGPPFVDGK